MIQSSICGMLNIANNWLVKAVLWSGTAFSLFVVAARLAIRWKLLGMLKADDFFVISGLVFYLASTLIWTIIRHSLYLGMRSGSDMSDPLFMVSLLDEIATTLHGTLAGYLCSWACLWSIKLSFMAFFHGLGRQIRSQRILWWSVLAFILASFIVVVSIFHYRCMTSTGLDTMSNFTPRSAPSPLLWQANRQ
jgi:hypothetical protein